MNISVYRVATQIELPLKVDSLRTAISNPEFQTCETGMHIIVIDDNVYLKTTTDSFCSPLSTPANFILKNESIFEKVYL